MEELETIKASIINQLRQKLTSLSAEASFNWSELSNDEANFDSDLQLIAAIEGVTKERLLACFKHVFFDNPRRMNLKINSHEHADDKETV